MSIVFTILWMLAMIWTFYLSKKLHRNVIIWLIVGLIVSPVVSLIALYFLGESHDR